MLLHINGKLHKKHYTKLEERLRLRDPLNRNNCKIGKARTDQAGSNLMESNSRKNSRTPCHVR